MHMRLSSAFVAPTATLSFAFHDVFAPPTERGTHDEHPR
jgi:hypothetical protein